MIPKTIHYCWLSNDKKPNLIKHCMDTWQRIMPEYNIKCWNMDNIQDCNIPFVQEAISVKQYPAAADYIRLYALYTEGGIYLDSDVEILRPLDVFLHNDFFTGTEAAHFKNEIGYNIEAAIIGSIRGHPFINECMKYFENHHFLHDDGAFDNQSVIMPRLMGGVAHDMYSYDYQNKEYHFKDGVTIYSTEQFTNNLCLEEYFTTNTYAIHRNAASWRAMEHRGWLFHFCRKHNMMDLYNKLEQIHLKR